VNSDRRECNQIQELKPTWSHENLNPKTWTKEEKADTEVTNRETECIKEEEERTMKWVKKEKKKGSKFKEWEVLIHFISLPVEMRHGLIFKEWKVLILAMPSVEGVQCMAMVTAPENMFSATQYAREWQKVHRFFQKQLMLK